MTISEEILTIANIIANNGQKPTIALIKTKLTTNVPLPTIIASLKVWQHDPNYTSLKTQPIENHVSPTNNENSVEVSEAIALALSPIKQELAEIKLLLKKLIQKN